MSLWSQLLLLLGKNVTLRKRQPVTLFIEFLWPILIISIVALIKRAAPPVIKGPCYYQPLELPNGDFLSFLRSFVCMLDYKCYDSSRLKDSDSRFQTKLSPLYDIVVSKDDSYEKISVLLENLKNALIDVNELRNEPIVQKIQSGSISINDFLNDTNLVKQELLKYGLDERISDAYLSSKIKIIEIYKVLNFSSKIKEKNLCTPMTAMSNLIASSYFNNSQQLNDLLNTSPNPAVRNLTNTQLVNYNMANLVCSIPKRQIISDADFLFKQLNISFFTNYSSTIVNFFSGDQFNQTVYYLTRFFVSGQAIAQELSVFSEFSDLNEISKIVQNALLLLDVVQKYDQQILFAKKIISDFSPVFSDIKEWNQLETLVDFIISINKILKQLDRAFTVHSLFGTSLVDIFEKRLGSEAYISNDELLRTKVNFERSLQFILKLKYGDAYEAVCSSPKITGIFNNDFGQDIKSDLDYKLEKYCEADTPAMDELVKQVFAQLNYIDIFQTVRGSVDDETLNEFFKLSNKLSTMSFQQANFGIDIDNLMQAFGTINALLDFLGPSLTDTSRLNLQNFYQLGKKILQIFAPGLISQQQWVYIDLLAPILLPKLDQTTSALQTGRSFEQLEYDPQSLVDYHQDLMANLTTDYPANLNLTHDGERMRRSIDVSDFFNGQSENSTIFEDGFYHTDDTDDYDLTVNLSSSERRINRPPNRRKYQQDHNSANINLFDLSSLLMNNMDLGSSLAKAAPDINLNLADLLGLGAATTTTTSKPAGGSFSLLNLLNGAGTGGSSLSTLTSLLPFLPVDQLFPNSSPQVTLGLITSIPQIVNLVDSFNNFKLPETNSKDPSVILKEWTAFVGDVRTKALNLIQILTNLGQVKPEESKIIQSILSANLETISNPEVIGKIVLACQAVNIWEVIQPNVTDVKNAVITASHLIDITDLLVNTTAQLVSDDGSSFRCTNDPFMDYYNLTKSLNVLDIATRLKQLLLNQPPTEMGPINCLKIDSIYQRASKLKSAFENDYQGVMKKKFDCFRTSIFLPYSSIVNNLKDLFSVASENAGTISILGTQMNKLIDLVKLLSFANQILQSSSSLLNNPMQLGLLINSLPSILADVNKLSSTLNSLKGIQSSINLASLNGPIGARNFFAILDSLKPFQPQIQNASIALDAFWKKYSDILSFSNYSSVIFDVQKGLESLGILLNFYTNNFNGVKINNIFLNYTIIEDYLRKSYGFSPAQTQAIGDSKIYYDPQKIFNLYMDAKEIYCNADKLKQFLAVNNSNYLELNYSNIDNFWQLSSNFVCYLNVSSLSDLGANITSYFTLPDKVQEIFLNDSSILQKLTRNSSIFTNLNISTTQILNSNSINKLTDMFNIFSSTDTNVSLVDLPNLFGRTLCGPQFSIRIENYGLSIMPAPVQLPTNTTLSNSTTPPMQTSRKAKIMNNTQPKIDDNYCAGLFKTLRSLGVPIIGNLITPLIFGKILYTPATNLTNRIMVHFNETFQQFDDLNRVLKSLATGINQLDDLRRLTANLSTLLDNPFYQDFIQLFLLQDSTLTISDVKNYLVLLESITALKNDWSYYGGLLGTFKNVFSCFEVDRFVAVETETELEQQAAQLFSNGTLLIGIVFENVKSDDLTIPPDFAVKIRTNPDNVPETNIIRPWLWVPGPADNLFMDLRYMRGFIQMQNLLERALGKVVNEMKYGTMSEITKNMPVVYLNQFPYPKYKSEDNTGTYVNYFILPIVITLMWSGNIGLAIRNLVKEKEKFIEETMTAMGLRPGVNWLAWFMTTYAATFLVAIFVSIILKFGSIFPETNLFLIIVSLCSFAFSSIMLSFFISSFFNKTNLASLIGILTYFVSYLPFILVMSFKYEIAFISKFALCLFSATGFGYSSLYISWYEQQGKGLQFKDIWTSPIINDSMNFGWSIVFMIMDGFIYGMLGWYVKKIFPGRYGASEPWYFIFTPRFWSTTICCLSISASRSSGNEYLKDRSFKEKKGHKSKDKFNETEPTHLPIGISIQGMSKKFREKTVVNNLTLNFFEGQITALLGHNGAGKSTTINVLTGIYAPTSGTAYINSRDVRYEYDQIRKNVGICPQHDTLFEYMTVKEHLLFYAKLKGNMKRKEIKKDINEMMSKMGLVQYSNDFVSALSGGLRRRLEVAIAFVSGSKTVILDEPTSGVDPYNRMKIWDIILEFRTGRTILLTTHYLEEADILSDRIAIIHQGKLQCCGSSLFLKNRFGSGYILTIDKKLINPSSASISLTKQVMLEARTRSTEIINQFIAKRILGATLTRQINNTLNFTLPYAQKPFFKDFFTELEKNKNALDIASYGISDTTLEEIFLLFTTRDENGELVNMSLNTKLAEVVSSNINQSLNNNNNIYANIESDRDSGVAIELNSLDATMDKISMKQKGYGQQNSILQSPNITLNTSIDTISQSQSINNLASKHKYTKLKGNKLYLQQFGALLLKRLHHYRRNLRILFTNILLPCIFVAISMAFTTIKPAQVKQNKLEMSPTIYKPNDVFYAFDKTNNQILNSITSDYLRSFNSVCSIKSSGFYTDSSTTSTMSKSKLTVNNYLCGLISSEKCSVIYQMSYSQKQSQSSIENTLGLAPTAPNCSVEPFVIDTHNDFINSRYGGIIYADNIINSNIYANRSKIIVWFENQAFHSSTSFLHEFYSTYMECALNSQGDGRSCNLIAASESEAARAKPAYRIYNHPLSVKEIRISYDTIMQKVADIGISLTILCAYSFIPAGFVVYVVRERITQEKRLQYVCGVKPFLYWLSSFVWDFTYYLLIMSLTIIVIGAFNSTAYTANSRNFGSLIILLILFGWSSLPMSYMLSRFFKDTDTAYMIVFCFTLFSGIATCVAVFLLSFLSDTNPSIVITYKVIEKLSLLFPSFSLGSGLIELTKNQIISDAYSIFGKNGFYKDPYSFDLLGQKYLSLALSGVLFFIIIAIMESKINFFPCCKPNIESLNNGRVEDVDVSQERKRIQNDEANYDILVVKNLTKRYRKATGSRVCAVNNVCFSIPWGHCFGLLGINGAGKTTTFKMITDEITPTFGSCLFNNMNLKEFLKDNIIGYCPQFDAVDEYLTGKEALYIYSKLIGINEITQAMLSSINKFKLQSYIDIPIVKYSGGMKRTLSVAVSMLGDPEIVLLDEPTNAMDPEMRRRVWNNILNLIKDDHSVLLTSHSMAECDALCSRLAIMVNGNFMCLGTTQHLKHRFGGGYTLQIKVLKDSALNSVIDFVESKFLNCIMKDKHGNKLEYIIPHRGNSLAKIFGFMETNKEKYSIAEYSLSQTTLDQVFINFAKSSHDDDDSDDDDEEEEVEVEENDQNYDQEDKNNIQKEQKTVTNGQQQAQMKVTTAPQAVSSISSSTVPQTDDSLDTNNITDESIKNHFDSLKKKSSRHIRKTSSAKSQDFKKQIHRNRTSQKSSSRSAAVPAASNPNTSGVVPATTSSIKRRSSNLDDEHESAYSNLAYEIEYKNSDECELPIQESSQDLTTSINGEEGDFFSRF